MLLNEQNLTIMQKIGAKLIQWGGTIGMGLLGSLDASVPHFVPCVLVIVLDVVTAVMLDKRLKKKYPGKAEGKFKSKYKWRVLLTFGIVFALMIIGGHIDQNILGGGHKAVNSVMVAFLFYELWSCVENWSSENDNKIAKACQRVMVNKAERHLNVPLSDILTPEGEKDENNENKQTL